MSPNTEVHQRSGISTMVTSYVILRNNTAPARTNSVSEMTYTVSSGTLNPSIPNVIDAYLCLAMLHAWNMEYQHSLSQRLWSGDGYLRRQKANDQLEKTARSPSQRVAQQSSEGCQCPTAIYAVEI